MPLWIKGSDILIKHNDHVYRISQDDELWDLRIDNLSKVRGKKKGVYGKIRNNVLCKVKDKRNLETTSSLLQCHQE
jgi:hypothetical protein